MFALLLSANKCATCGYKIVDRDDYDIVNVGDGDFVICKTCGDTLDEMYKYNTRARKDNIDG